MSFKGTDVTPWLGSKVVCLARAPQRMLARIVPVVCWTPSCICSLHLNLVKGEVHIEAAQF